MPARPYASTGGIPLEFFARLLARHGRMDEAVTRLSAGIDDWLLATALVDITEGVGRDEDITALLAVRIPAQHRCDSPWCCRGLNPDTAIGLLDTIRERQGRVDESLSCSPALDAPRRLLPFSNSTPSRTAMTWLATSSTWVASKTLSYSSNSVNPSRSHLSGPARSSTIPILTPPLTAVR
ncbi:hypothetical protein [Streptomyces sp. NPDC006997]|uniref:hypothetical protein n=1 Tax=Streptomyces sp. NPDC006997 TaxID=3155356 RepID=UPI0033F787F8